MRRTVTSILTITATVLAFAGCGGSSNGDGSTGAGSSDAKAAVVAAFKKLRHESFRERLRITSKVDTNGLPKAEASGLGAGSPTIRMSGEFESSRRISMVETIPPALSDAHFVLYDGASYIAVDGVHFRRLSGALADSVGSLAKLGAQGPAKYIVGVQQLGGATIAGQAVDHLRGRLDANGVKSLTKGVGGPIGSIASAVTIGHNQVDIFVSKASGQVVRTTTRSDSTVDLGKLLPNGGGDLKGKLKIAEDVIADVSDVGAKITIKRPHVSAGGTLALPTSGGAKSIN